MSVLPAPRGPFELDVTKAWDDYEEAEIKRMTESQKTWAYSWTPVVTGVRRRVCVSFARCYFIRHVFPREEFDCLIFSYALFCFDSRKLNPPPPPPPSRQPSYLSQECIAS
jgi:hypothetical protein